MLEGRAEPYKGLLEIFDNHEEILLAIFIQNCLHPKNGQRVEAIKDGSYLEINSQFIARNYLTALLKQNLELELKAAESVINEQIEKLKQMHDVKVLLEAPDVFIAAAALSSLKFYIGKGDRSAFFKIILETDPAKIPDLYRKLQLVTNSDFMGMKLFNDKLCSPDSISRTMIFRLWLHTTRKN